MTFEKERGHLRAFQGKNSEKGVSSTQSKTDLTPRDIIGL